MPGSNSSGSTTGAVRSVLYASLLPPVHWKNGGGITREIALAPQGAGYADFDWRLSLADIVESGPFSSLPGVDRHFLMGTKGSLKMIIDGRPRQLALGSRAVFAGEADVAVEVIQGPTRNLNLMTRREVCGGSIEMLQIRAPFLVGAGRGPVAVVVLAGTVELKDGTTLEPFHVLIPGPDEEPVLGHDALVAAVRVWRKPPA
ncbi:HutD/Ves family protein [Pseudarthrobacter sp. NS4]|uniref:HutD/Ves family protein n=1 Tax=Pseudarthrobacter sp. NS4 TaxID=2973976 RepID=UPI0021624DFB|nr:HutD family protein [Pseudarthrobacter sp. NS4]